MKKTLSLLLALGLALALMAGCTQTLPLPESLNKDTIEAEAKAVVDDLNERNWASFVNYFPEAGASEKDWEDGFAPILDELGAFERYDSFVSTGYQEDKTDYGIVLVTAKYENGKKIYQVTFSVDGKIAGFHLVG